MLLSRPEHAFQHDTLRTGRYVHSKQHGDAGSNVNLLDIRILARTDASTSHDERFEQHDRVLPAVAAAVDLAVVGDDDHGILSQIHVRNDLLQQVIGPRGGLVPAVVARTALVVAGIVHLVDVDQDELILPGIEPGKRGVHHIPIRESVLAGGVVRLVDGLLRDELLEPVVPADRGPQAGPVRGAEQVILCPCWDIRILQVHGRPVIDIGPGAGHQAGVSRLRVRGRAAVHGGPRALLAQLVQEWHHFGFVGGVIAQGVDQHEHYPPG